MRQNGRAQVQVAIMTVALRPWRPIFGVALDDGLGRKEFDDVAERDSLLVKRVQVLQEYLHLLLLQTDLHLAYELDELRLVHNAVAIRVHRPKQS